MGERVIVVDSDLETAERIAARLTQRGYRVIVAATADEACGQPRRFDCGIFSDQLPADGAVALAGWLMAEERIRVAVFYGQTDDRGARLRACNLGSYVTKGAGIDAVVLAALDALGETPLAKAVGAEADTFRAEIKTGSRRRL